MAENRDDIKSAEKYPGQYDGMFDEYDGPPVGFGDGHQTHFSVPKKKLRDTGVDDGYEWVQIGLGKWKRVKKRLRAGEEPEEHDRGTKTKRKRRTRRRVGVDAPAGAE